MQIVRLKIGIWLILHKEYRVIKLATLIDGQLNIV